MTDSHNYDNCRAQVEISNLKDWQERQNGHLEKLAESYDELATCIKVDKAYRQGVSRTWKVVWGIVGVLASGGGIASLVQLFSGG